jgi:hypothetical protein
MFQLQFRSSTKFLITAEFLLWRVSTVRFSFRLAASLRASSIAQPRIASLYSFGF